MFLNLLLWIHTIICFFFFFFNFFQLISFTLLFHDWILQIYFDLIYSKLSRSGKKKHHNFNAQFKFHSYIFWYKTLYYSYFERKSLENNGEKRKKLIDPILIEKKRLNLVSKCSPNTRNAIGAFLEFHVTKKINQSWGRFFSI